MKGRITCLLTLVILWASISSCAGPHRLKVVYDHSGGLKSGDRVFSDDQIIGAVETPRVDSRGRILVPLKIKPNFRRLLTDQSRFLIQDDSLRPGNGSVRVIQLAPGGKSLPEGATIEGSTTVSLWMEKGSRELESWSKLLQDWMDRLEEKLRQFSEEEWPKEMERQMEKWARELERSGEDARRYFQDEVLPRLEKTVQDLIRRLKDQGREEDIKRLKEKLERLKRTFRS